MLACAQASKPHSGGARRALCRALVAVSLALAGHVPASAEAPSRVVSMNLCTDQLALLIAAPGQIVSLSHHASNPEMSVLADLARAYPANHGRAEELYVLGPDLVLADVWSSPATLSMLRRLGVEVVQFSPGTSLSDIRGARQGGSGRV
jgi:iron complex transport system substrate-binding protein